MKYGDFKKLTSIKTPAAFKAHLDSLGLAMPCDETIDPADLSPLMTPVDVDGMAIGNRITAQPMEGWDCTNDGGPTEATSRRWAKFGQSGAKLILVGKPPQFAPTAGPTPGN